MATNIRKTSRPGAVVVSRASVRLAKTNASHAQFLDGFDQLLHRARQAVELPHDQRVAAAREFQRVAKGWSIRNRARQLLGENPPASRFGERIPLQDKILVDGRDPRVA